MEFIQVEPTLENFWRGIILFGRNVASYKFALANALCDLGVAQNELIKMDDLAVPFARHICRHLKESPKQSTSKQGRFLDACVAYNQGELDESALRTATLRWGFDAVIDAFHNVNGGEIEKRFFIDERKNSKGIRLTDNFFLLRESEQFASLVPETEARWNLVQEGWALNLPPQLISVKFDRVNQLLFTDNNLRRVNITHCRDSLNGYQKGRCFYCFREISVCSGDENLAHVDHFIPWHLMSKGFAHNLDAIWNLVLACRECNSDKSARIPTQPLVERLYQRNAYLMKSLLPLRETLQNQLGRQEPAQLDFTRTVWNAAYLETLAYWEPKAQGEATF